MEEHGITVPLVADIHFSPKTAMDVVTAVDKVRVNPGNFADGVKRIDTVATTEAAMSDFKSGNIAIRESFIPLVRKLKSNFRALRIGTNHGSLSNRILAKYGDTPEGMVASAIEFALIALEEDFHDLIFSMKASNPLIMVRAYRLLVREMIARNWRYPIHLGVTEAGQGEDGRIKSAVGIGALLVDGIGDTIRVSLTEDPWFELEPCGVLAAIASEFSSLTTQAAQLTLEEFDDSHRHSIDIFRRPVSLPAQEKEDKFADVRGWMHRDGSVYVLPSPQELESSASIYKAAGVKMAVDGEVPVRALQTADGIFLEDHFPSDSEARKALKNIHDAGVGLFFSWRLANSSPVRKFAAENNIEFAVIIELKDLAAAHQNKEAPELPEGAIRYIIEATGWEDEALWKSVKIAEPPPIALIYSPPRDDRRRAFVHGGRRVYSLLMSDPKLKAIPMILRHSRAPLSEEERKTWLFDSQFSKNAPPQYDTAEGAIMRAAVDVGGLLLDSIGEGVLLETTGDFSTRPLSTAEIRSSTFTLLQTARMRRTKTEFVSCPSCGRTLFDLQEVTNKIKALTGHIPGVAIAVMGCIVNGPGEMADADFGYVGGAPGKVDLYVGRDVVERGVPNEEAPLRLVELIKKNGRWIDPPASNEDEEETGIREEVLKAKKSIATMTAAKKAELELKAKQPMARQPVSLDTAIDRAISSAQELVLEKSNEQKEQGRNWGLIKPLSKGKKDLWGALQTED